MQWENGHGIFSFTTPKKSEENEGDKSKNELPFGGVEGKIIFSEI